MLPSLVNLNHQLASRLASVTSPVLPKLNTLLALRFVLVITFQVSESVSYLRPKFSYAPIRSIKSSFKASLNVVVKFGITLSTVLPFGIICAKVTGPKPDSKLPTPALAPSPSTAPILAQALSSALSVPAVTNVLFKNSLESGDVNFIKAPGFAYLKLDVAESPITKAPPDVKYPVLVFVPVVVEFQVAFKLLKSLVPYFK